MSAHRLFRAYLAVLLLTMLGCGPSRSEESSFVREWVGDTLHVHSVAPLYAEPATLKAELRIGVLEGPEEYLFRDIRSLAIGPQGEIYVGGVDEGIREFRPDGTFARWVARKGPGPREVGLVSALAVSPEGVLVARDRSSRRIKLFHPNGVVETFPAPADPERYHEDALQFHTDGSLWVGINPPLTIRGPVPFPRPIFARISSTGELVDTIFAPRRLGEICPLLPDTRYSSGIWLDRREPWWPLAKWAQGPDGSLALGCPDDYAFEVIRPGRPILRISRDWTPVRTTPGEAEYWANAVSLWPGNLQLPPLPKLRPAYARLILPGDGRVWVWPVYPSERREVQRWRGEQVRTERYWWVAEHGAFDVFREDGVWLGRVQLPEEIRYGGYYPPHLVIRGDTIWGVATDSLDVQRVARYRVVWPDAPGQV